MLNKPIYDPVPMLAADVNGFWALEEDQESYNREVYLPDAYIEVIINVGAPLVLESEHGRLELPRAFVNPFQHKPLRLRVAGFCPMISMQFYPWVVKPILNIDPDPSTVDVIGVDASLQRFADDLTQIVAHRGYTEAVDCYQEYVCKTAYRQKHDLRLLRTAGHVLHRRPCRTELPVVQPIRATVQTVHGRFAQGICPDCSLWQYPLLITYESIRPTNGSGSCL